MTKYRKRAAGLAVVLGLAAFAPAAGAGATAPPPVAVAAKACVNGQINGESKHLCRGQFCQRAARAQYPKYGFRCGTQDRNGRWHLR